MELLVEEESVGVVCLQVRLIVFIEDRVVFYWPLNLVKWRLVSMTSCSERRALKCALRIEVLTHRVLRIGHLASLLHVHNQLRRNITAIVKILG